jgi:hypothetical protein
MRGPMDRARAGSVARWVAAFGLVIPLAGCASTTRSVDAYYRQMAVNYQEALDKAKLDEVALENQSKVLGATGDQSKYRKAKRQIEKIRSWEEHCAKEKKRFEKAAEWMESHLKVDKSVVMSKLDVKDPMLHPPDEDRAVLKAGDTSNPEKSVPSNLKELRNE